MAAYGRTSGYRGAALAAERTGQGPEQQVGVVAAEGLGDVARGLPGRADRLQAGQAVAPVPQSVEDLQVARVHAAVDVDQGVQVQVARLVGLDTGGCPDPALEEGLGCREEAVG